MLNKLQFNNLVITNKNKIQQVKTQTIHKFVQKIRKLKSLIEKKPDDKKAQERFRKSTLCLEELKKLKRIELMKNVLVLDKSATGVLTNGRSSPDEIAVAMAACNKIMQDLVQHFRGQLQLTDDDTKWKKEIMRASKRRIKISRTEQKRQKRQALKEQKALARKRVEWLKGQKQLSATSDSEEEHESATVSTLGVWKVEPIENESMPKHALKPSKLKTTVEKGSIQQNDTKTKVKDPKLNIRKVQETHPGKSGTKEKQFKKSMVSSFNEDVHSEPDDANAFDDSLYTSDKSQENQESATAITTHVIDPFFITESGENYRSTAVIVRDGKIIEPTTMPVERRNKWNGGTDERRTNHSEKPYGRRNRDEKSFSRIDANNRNLPKATNLNNAQGLHPSSAAKQKLKPVITAFQGKKIKISDDDNNDNTAVKNQFQVNPNVTTTVRRKENDKNRQPAMHPSWEAKQKLKPIITEFKGKKITFNDDKHENVATSKQNKHSGVPKDSAASKTSSNTTLNSSVDDLHPSWAAKQKLKPTITAFQGKKITFNVDDDDT